MEAIGDIQETYNIWSWLLPLISGAIGALIGTYGGSYFLHWKQEKKIKNVRAMAVKALNVFRAYAKKSYIDTANEFNNKLNISEKRAVVVALHKIGVPFEISTKDDFDIKNLRLKDIIIDRDEIDAMIQQIEKGLRKTALFHNVTFCTSKPFYLEFFNSKVSKAAAIYCIGKLYNFTPAETIAIGDGFNDLSMIRYAALGVAMENAPDGVKESADYITARTNNEDGVAEVLEKFVL